MGRSAKRLSPRHCAYVFAVVGDQFAREVRVALRFLKRLTRAEMLVLRARSTVDIAHDQVTQMTVPPELDDRRASIYLKTGLQRWVAGLARCYCYLDSDVIAVREDVDDIFAQRRGVVNFASDHKSIDRFSRWAVECGCGRQTCSHLREAIEHHFGIEIPSGDWTMRNGGVYLFDGASEEFLSTWHAMTLRTFELPFWKARDQGTLAATAWKFRSRAAPMLSSRFNFIIDRLAGVPEERRAALRPEEYPTRGNFSLRSGQRGRQASLIHFINGGVGRVGWRHWDEVAALLTPRAGQPAADAVGRA